MPGTQDIIARSEELQKECHDSVTDMVLQNPVISYQDATNVWIFNKLADLELQIEESARSIENYIK